MIDFVRTKYIMGKNSSEWDGF